MIWKYIKLKKMPCVVWTFTMNGTRKRSNWQLPGVESMVGPREYWMRQVHMISRILEDIRREGLEGLRAIAFGV